MIVSRLFNQFLDWHRNRDAIKHLLSLPDHQLNDIGLSRRGVMPAMRTGAKAGSVKDA